MDQRKQHFDLADSSRADMQDHTNEKKLGAMKDETKGLIIKEFVAVKPKCYNYNVHTVDKHKQNCKKMKGVSKVVVKKEIKHEDFVNNLNSNQLIQRDFVNVRSFSHQVYTITQSKIASTSFYDKAHLIDSIHNVQFGYDPLGV
jgi:GMP synthase PP-ATPase subunit